MPGSKIADLPASGEAITIWLRTEAKEFFPICNISYIKLCGNV